MTDEKTISALVSGGTANAGPPLGPALAPLGVNTMAVVKEINEKTKEYSGMRIPVKITVNTGNNQFTVTVVVPTSSALIAKELGITKGSGTPNTEFVGEISMEQLKNIATVKLEQSYAITIKSAVKEIIGSCVSMGIKVEGQDPRTVFEDFEKGKWDKMFD